MAEVSALRDLEELRGYTRSNPLSVSPQEAVEVLESRGVEAAYLPFESSWNPFDPNFRSTVRSSLNDLFGGSNIASNSGYRRGRIADALAGLVDFAPAIGDAVGVGDTMTSYRQGDMLGTGINALATGVGVLPLVGGPASKAVRAGGNRVRSSLRDLSNPRFAESYPQLVPPELKIDKKSGKEFYGKVLSPDELELQTARKAAQADINAGNYEPYFPLEERFNVNPSNYPVLGNTRVDAMPKKQQTIDKFTEQFNTPEIKDRLLSAYMKGNSPSTRDWYAMGQLEKEFVDVLGEEQGRAMFKERFADSMAATTGGADPTANLLTGSYMNYQKANNLPIPSAAYEAAHPVGGRYLMGNVKFGDKILNQGEILSSSSHPKRHNFSANFRGHTGPATIDEQMSQLYDPKLRAPPGSSYGVMEQVLADVAEQVGVSPMNFQDVAWAGAKGIDGKPMIQHVNEAIERTARVTGKSREAVVRDSLINAKSPLYGLAAAGMLGSVLNEEELSYFEQGI